MKVVYILSSGSQEQNLRQIYRLLDDNKVHNILDPGDLGLKAIRLMIILEPYLGPLFGTPMDTFGPIKT